MPRLLQRIALDFGEFEVRLGFEGSEDIFSAPQSHLFSQFIQKRKLSLFEKKKKVLTFASLYDHGVIRDIPLLTEYLRFIFLEAGVSHHPLLRLEVYVTIATGTPQTTKTVWVQILENLGASSITFCVNALSAAIGAGFSFPVPSFALLIHLGHSRSEVAGVALTRCLFSTPLEWNSFQIKTTLEAQIFRIYGKELTQSFWEKLLMSIGGFLPGKTSTHAEYAQFIEEISSTWQIPEEFLIEQVSRLANRMTTQLLLTLESLSADELSSCTQNGIVLTGGMAKVDGIAPYLSSVLQMPVYPASTPELAPIRGTVVLIKELSQTR